MSTPLHTVITREALATSTPPDVLLGNKESAAEARMAQSTWHRDRARGLVPPPDSFNGCRPLWWRSTIRAWVASKAKKKPTTGTVESTSLAALAAEAAKQATVAAQAAMAAAEAARQAAAAIVNPATP
jgi:hypothetical protein